MFDTDIILQSLQKVRWHVAKKTFGSDHATLIGLLVDWWISECQETNWALESGPSNGYSAVGTRGQCDALLCQENAPVGVLEVEGSRKEETAKKIGTFFAAENKVFETLQFGILVFYSYEPSGKGDMRKFDEACPPEASDVVRKVSRKYPQKPIVVISVEKTFSRISEGIRSTTEYYKGTPSVIAAECFTGGDVISKKEYYRAI